jgi:hypothetical protein
LVRATQPLVRYEPASSAYAWDDAADRLAATANR